MARLAKLIKESTNSLMTDLVSLKDCCRLKDKSADMRYIIPIVKKNCSCYFVQKRVGETSCCVCFMHLLRLVGNELYNIHQLATHKTLGK